MINPRPGYIKSCCKDFLLLVFILFSVSLLAADNDDSAEYRIGIGDVVQISVWQYDQFNVTAPVGPDGKINVPVLGETMIKGQTKKEIKAELAKKITQFVKEGADITVNIAQYNSQKISIFGQVLNPRTISFSVPPSLLEIMVQVVPSPDADLTSIKIISGDPSVREAFVVNIGDILKSGDTSKLPKLHPGDTIYVPKIAPVLQSSTVSEKTPANPPIQTQTPSATGSSKQEANFIINVMGAVNEQSSFAFTEEPTLPQVLIKAKSVSNDILLKDVTIIRSSPTNGERILHVDMTKYLLDGDSSALPRLYNGDLIYIAPLSQEKIQESSIVVIGEVNKPGTYPVEKPLDILDAISLAGGLSASADPEKIRIRKEENNFYLDKIINIEELIKDASSNAESDMVGPGYRIYVPSRQRNLTIATAMSIREVATFLVSLIPIIGLYSLIKD